MFARPSAAILFAPLLVGLVACPGTPPDDEEPAAPTPAPSWVVGGSVRYWDGVPMAGARIEARGLGALTDEFGRFSFELNAAPPVQVDVGVTDGEAHSAVTCAEEEQFWAWMDSPGTRGAAAQATVRLHGVDQPENVVLIAGFSRGDLWISTTRPELVELEEVEPGVLEWVGAAESGTPWVVVAVEFLPDGLTWAWSEPEALDDGQSIELDLTMAAPTGPAFPWDGLVGAEVEETTIEERVEWRGMGFWVPVARGAGGPALDLPVLDGRFGVMEYRVQRWLPGIEDGCSTEDVTQVLPPLFPGEFLSLPALPERVGVRLTDAGSRPVVAWDAPAEYDDAALWTWVWDGSAWSTVWSATLRRDCAIEVEWPAVLGDLTPGHDGYFDFYGTGDGFTTHCAFARSW